MLTVAQARDRVRSLARNGQDTDVYSDSDIDYAVQHVLNDFVGATKCLRQTNSLTLTPASTTIDASTITNFRAALLLRAWVVGYPSIGLPGHEAVIQKLYSEAQSGPVRLIGFSDATSGDAWPTPDLAYVLKLLWCPPATLWTVGSDNSTTINVPTDLLIPILGYGATAVLQHSDVKHRYASASWGKYEAFKAAHMDAGNLGAQVEINDPLM